MIDYVLLTPILLLPIVALLAFVGCGFQAGTLTGPFVPVVSAVAGNGQVILTWGPDIMADMFSVYRGVASGVYDPNPIKEVLGGAGFIDNTVTNGTEYFYVVTATGSTYTTGPSVEVSATPTGPVVSPTVTAFVTGKVLGNTVSANGWFGMAFQVGSQAVIVRELGRAFAPGNSGLHPLRLIDAAASSDVAGYDITMVPGTIGQFQYGMLSTPVTLNANSLYYLVSREMTGGDQFYNHTTTVQTTSVAAITGSVIGDGTTHSVDQAGQIAYGPVDFRYVMA